MPRELLLVGNWKMHHGLSSAKAFCSAFAREEVPSHVKCWIAPPLSAMGAFSGQSRLCFGAQNVHWEKEGAFTGEVNAESLKELGCSFSICGHSERRALFGESDASAVKRACAALNSGMQAILCVGESATERAAQQTAAVLELQLSQLPQRTAALERLIIAYEPTWAVGTNLTPTTKEIQQAHSAIEKALTSKGYSNPRILYGGSVNSDNIAEICGIPNVAGALVGRASLDAQCFAQLARSLA